MVDRRRFLIGLGTGIAGMSLPVFASLATSCKIIGIGGAGCNLVVALRGSNALNQAGAVLDYVCVDLGEHALQSVEAANAANPAQTPIKTLMLAPFGAGGRINTARAVALRQREALQGVVADADMVILVAGLGGGTGSGITPIMSRIARIAGAVTIAAVVTPFDFEGVRMEKAARALGYLQRGADVVLAISNSKWANRYSNEASISEVFAGLDQHMAEHLRSAITKLGFQAHLLSL